MQISLEMVKAADCYYPLDENIAKIIMRLPKTNSPLHFQSQMTNNGRPNRTMKNTQHRNKRECAETNNMQTSLGKSE